jgi:hypothetical protein
MNGVTGQFNAESEITCIEEWYWESQPKKVKALYSK